MSREALREILGVPTDAALGFVNDRSARAAVKLENVDRRQFLHTPVGVGALAALGPVAALLASTEPTPTPTRVGATDIEQIRTATQVFESWGDVYGGRLLRETVMGQLRCSAGFLHATCPEELHSALGDLADVAGHMAVDAGADEQARRVFGFALARAEEADDWPLRAQILSSMAQHAVQTGQPDEGLTLAEHGLVRPDRLTAAGRSVLHTIRGRALAKMRRGNEALTAIVTAASAWSCRPRHTRVGRFTTHRSSADKLHCGDHARSEPTRDAIRPRRRGVQKACLARHPRVAPGPTHENSRRA